MKITGVLLDVEKKIIEVKTIEKSVDTFYKLLNCKEIKRPTIIINDQKFVIVCDGEGALKEDRKPSVFIITNQQMPSLFHEFIYGNVFITKFDGIDDFESLNGKEIKKILEAVRVFPEGPIIIGTI